VTKDLSILVGACKKKAKQLSAYSLFSGLIDDIRIYNQALSADQIEELAR